jgi:hypothetical protein
MYRTCTDSNSCNTFLAKPADVETCTYQGTCEDGLMNGGEEGIDCGTRCQKACAVAPVDLVPSIEIAADDIEADILSSYKFRVTLTNHGENEAENLRLTVDKWTDQKQTFDYILKGQSLDYDFTLSLPGDQADNQLTIQLFYKDSLIAERKVDVKLNVPLYSMMLAKDSEDNLYSILIVDNRNHIDRKITMEYAINRAGQTLFADTDQNYDVTQGMLYHKIDNFSVQNLPDGDYQVKAIFYTDGVKVGESETHVTIERGIKDKVPVAVFYVILALISVGVLFMYYRICRGDS